jgi:putative NIF3 family GTP cyclohydrolase 1 type 2
LGVALLLAGHYASERFAQEYLATTLAEAFPDVTVWASRRECDPLRWL